MPAPAAGRMRQVLRYETKTETADALGQTVEYWTASGTYRGEVRTPNGRESLLAQTYRATVSHVITTRYVGAPFSPLGRFVDVTVPGTPRVYNVVASSDPDGKQQSLVTYATEVVNPTESDTGVILQESGDLLLQEDASFLLV